MSIIYPCKRCTVGTVGLSCFVAPGGEVPEYMKPVVTAQQWLRLVQIHPEVMDYCNWCIEQHAHKYNLIDPCTVPPEGWWCSRGKGHEGPCAAREEPKDDQS